jgi:fimbrial isopeptide formation D2 family protein
VRLLVGMATALSLLFGFHVAMLPSSASADEMSAVSVTKTNNLDGKELEPGDEFVYTISAQCSGLTVDCVHFTITDTLPAEFEVTSLPKSDSSRDVTYDAATRKLTIVYKQPLQNPQGETGLRAGQTGSVEVGMRLPTDTQVEDGTVVKNTAEVSADNATPASADNDITVNVPLVVKPVATKAWADGSAVALSDEESTMTLGVRNESSSSADVTQLSVSDNTPETFEYFDFESATVTAFPKGADQAHLVVTTADGTTSTGDDISAPGALPLPAGVAPADVTGFEVVFTNSNGDPLPYDSTGGTVEAKFKLRDTYRSTGLKLEPTDKITVHNCATPSAEEKTSGSVNGDQACADYDILPDILVLNSTKQFIADTNGDYTHQSSEHAVVGENSPVSALVDVTNQSPFPVKTISVTEPQPGPVNAANFAKLDVTQVRLRFPDGATSAHLTVEYADGTKQEWDETADTTVDVAKTGTKVSKVEVTYTGVDADGNPTIKEGADAGLDLHGTLVDGVTAGPLSNCAEFTGDAGRTDGSGTAKGDVCQDLNVEDPNSSASGTKTADQTSIPEGQPVPMHLTVTNNGNKPLVDPVITDPTANADGSPDTTNNPFDYVQIDSVSISPSSTDATIQLWDPTANSGAGAWVAYDAADTDLLHRAKGVRVTYNGELAPEGTFTVNMVVERRAGVSDDVSFQNCFSISAGGDYQSSNPVCSAELTADPAEASASLNKTINPSTLPEYVPGLPRQHADLTLTERNTGNMSAKTLKIIDQDSDFFDAVDLVSIKSNQMPAGADRVQIDAYVNGQWVNGTPSATAALPSGVNAADVTGIRATYSSTSTFNDGYTITHCEAASCDAVLVLDVSPRPALRSSGGPVPSHLEDTASGQFQTKLSPLPKDIDDVSATLDLVKGSPRLAVEKTPDTDISPGEDAPFYLKVTNTGTANIPNLVVKDDLPQGIAFDDSFAGDNGEPYKIINQDVPSGTPAVPTPAFTETNTGSRVSGLNWDFSKDSDGKAWVLAPGATFTIEIHVTLEPGINADEVVTNTMGATSSDTDMVCEDEANQQIDGPMFGTGKYCTSSATLKAKSGAAFTARKWVSGNDSLGWYNTRTGKTVPVGDSSCLSTTQGGRSYTTNPCIALVNPGDQYHYLLRVQNSGTESGKAMRIVDRLPIEGDKGVIIDQNRGTAWNNRPTLASRPQLQGPAGSTMTTTYENDEPLCTDNLDMGGVGSAAAQCPSSTWDDSYGPAVKGMEMDLSFAPELAPGGTENITYAMDTPVNVKHNGDPTIAWNSYAHNEVTDRAGSDRVLQPNEPIQVGVGLGYGSLKLVKRIGKHPDSLSAGLSRVPFPYHVTCTISPQGGQPQTVVDRNYWVSADKPKTITGIPGGATCEVWENAARGGSTDHPKSDPIEVTIKAGYGTESVQTARITNDFEFGSMDLVKKVDGDAANYAAGRTYGVEVSCALPNGSGDPSDLVLHKKYEVSADKPTSVGPLPVNSQCWAEEVDTGGAGKAVVDHGSADDPVVISADDTVAITATNTFPGGTLIVNKHVAGGPAGPYDFTLDCTTPQGDVPLAADDHSFRLSDGDSRRITVPDGAECKVTERSVPSGDTVSYATSAGGKDGSATVHGTATVDVTNTFPNPPAGQSGSGGPGGPGSGKPGSHHGGALPKTGAGGWQVIAGYLAALTLLCGAGAWLLARRRRG